MERQPLMEDDLWWKMTFEGRWPLMVDNFCWKTTSDDRQLLMEDDFWWKTTFDGRWPLTEDDLWWKTTFDGRRPLTEENLWLKTIFDGRQPLMDLNHVGGMLTLILLCGQSFTALSKSFKLILQVSFIHSPHDKTLFVDFLTTVELLFFDTTSLWVLTQGIKST